MGAALEHRALTGSELHDPAAGVAPHFLSIHRPIDGLPVVGLSSSVPCGIARSRLTRMMLFRSQDIFLT